MSTEVKIVSRFVSAINTIDSRLSVCSLCAMQLYLLNGRKKLTRRSCINERSPSKEDTIKRNVWDDNKQLKGKVALFLRNFKLSQVSLKARSFTIQTRHVVYLRFKYNYVPSFVKVGLNAWFTRRETTRQTEVEIIVFTCNMEIALTCSSNSLIRSNDAAICSRIFYKYIYTPVLSE